MPLHNPLAPVVPTPVVNQLFPVFRFFVVWQYYLYALLSLVMNKLGFPMRPPQQLRRIRQTGKLYTVNYSPGITKVNKTEGFCSPLGIHGDKQKSNYISGRPSCGHGGYVKAVCLWSKEVIDELNDMGATMSYGTAGENLTFEGFDWSEAVVGRQIHIGDVRLLITEDTPPCRQQRVHFKFKKGDTSDMHPRKSPHRSRRYARVLSPGFLKAGDVAYLI